MVSTALDNAPDDGLFIVAIHAPLFNVWKDEYPYFLRQTQRPAQPGQTEAFLARHDDYSVLANAVPPEQQVKDHHPLWFASERDHRPPTFVKREDSQELLDFGVSRHGADDLMRVLAGIGSRRSADVVLSGHTHNQNEFSVRKMPTGELGYSMDFYTQNPFRYYPTRFTREWRRMTLPTPPTLVPETAVTDVEIAPDAAADATPWPTPDDASTGHVIQIPPYPNPLNGAPDPRAWWAEHRPLVLQTGAYGPLKVLDDFAGFRVLQVKNDIIDKIYFVPTGRLEENNYQLAWEEAIRVQPFRQYRHLEQSRPLGAPRASEGALAGVVFPALGTTTVVYRDEENRLHELWQRGTESGTSNLTDLARTNRAKGNPTLFIEGTGGSFVALYRGADDHVYGLHWSTAEVGGDSLSLTAGAPATGGNPVGFVQVDGTNIVVYRTSGNNLQTLGWKGVESAGNREHHARRRAPGCG